jgi:hypothetical protein
MDKLINKVMYIGVNRLTKWHKIVQTDNSMNPLIDFVVELLNAAKLLNNI